MRLSFFVILLALSIMLPCPYYLGSLPAAQAAGAGSTKEPGRQGYCRYATINGDQIVFSSEDDLWTVSADGGTARRLTAGKGVITMPRFSPDGKLLAFVSPEEGNPEIYVMPAEGGTARRLTHMGAGAVVISGWTPDGKEILFASNGPTAFGRETELFSVPAGGGMPRPLNLGDAVSVSISKSGAVALGRNNMDPARWKRYHGGTAGELWIGPSLDGNFKPLISLHGNLVCPQWVQERIYFLSDHEGVGNIYSCAPDGSDLKRHTRNLEYYVRFPSTDGKRIVFTAGARIFVLDPASGASREVNIVAPSNLTQARRKFVDAGDYLEEFAIHPKGHSVGLVVRGQPFTMPLFEGAVVDHGVGGSQRYEQFQWLPDGERFAVVTDAPGYHQIEIHQLDESTPPKVVTEGDLGRMISLAVSPVKSKIAFSNQKHDLYVVDYESKKLQKVDHSPADRIGDIAWSPDGRWLAYNYAETNSSNILKIADIEKGGSHEVTSAVRFDAAPSFDPDGKYLYFLSLRDYNPVPDQTQHGWSFPMVTRPFVVTLSKDVASPLVSRVRPFIKDKEEDKDKDKDKDKKESKDRKEGKGKKESRSSKENESDRSADKESDKSKDRESDKSKKKVADVKIDFEGISGRILALPVEQGDYRQLAAMSKGKVIYTRFPVKPVSHRRSWLSDSDKQGVLSAYDFDEQKESTVENGVEDFNLGDDHQTLVYRSKNRLKVIDASKKADDGGKKDASQEPGRESGWMDLQRLKVQVEPSAEWLQMFCEAWRLQKENFWAEDMSSVDWELVRKRYEALLPLVRTRSELSDLIWEMQGELGTSHAYEFMGDYEPSRSYRRGFLGADLSFDATSGGYRIDRIFRGDSWDPEVDSPLAEPGLNVKVGDVILAVGGRHASAEKSVDELLVDQAGQRVQLTIAAKADTGSKSGPESKNGAESSNDKKESDGARAVKPKQIVVKTLKSESALRYRSWVEANRKSVHDLSGGQLGYVHIPDMGVEGFSEFHRGFLAENRYPGLVVDVRYNGGGNVSSLLLEKLLRKRIGYDVSRWGLPDPYPAESIGGPMVGVTNQFAGSDGDIFSHAFKQYKLGPLIGKRTWGGVVGISANRRLVDGTITTQPEFAFWFSDVGWQVENYGVDPDEVVEITPQDYKAHRDPQLARAVELGLAALKEKPFKLPDFKARPAKTLPTSLPE
jgi:tricorn protease